MKVYIVLRETECFCDSLHIVGIAASKESADHIVFVTGDQYAPCRIEEHETDTITQDSLLRYQVVNESGKLYVTYVGDDKKSDLDLDAEVVYAHNHAEAISMYRKKNQYAP